MMKLITLTALITLFSAPSTAHEVANSSVQKVTSMSVKKHESINTTQAKVSNKEVKHSGRTDSSGCHNDRINGGYHCH